MYIYICVGIYMFMHVYILCSPYREVGFLSVANSGLLLFLCISLICYYMCVPNATIGVPPHTAAYLPLILHYMRP